MIRLFHRSLPVAVVALLGLAAPARAQQCVGMPSEGRGFLAYGFEGTDGGTGDGITFAYHGDDAGILLQRRVLKDVTLIDRQNRVEAQGSVRLRRVPVPACLVVGGNWTSYDSQREVSQTFNGNRPNEITQVNTVGGPYRRLRVPIGISVGQEFRVGRASVTPFVSPTVVYESETHRPRNEASRIRSTWGWGATGGVTAAAGWLVVRSALSHTATQDLPLSMQHEGPLFSLQAGVRF